MRKLIYFDGEKKQEIIEDGKEVVAMYIDSKKGNYAVVQYGDDRVDRIISPYMELKELPAEEGNVGFISVRNMMSK